MIAIIDYGMGNLRSVQKGLEKSGFQAEITSEPEEVKKARGIVLPGVGAFAEAMANLRKKGLDRVIREEVAKGKPFLGICLGLQLLFDYSEEGEGSEGLGIFPGRVRRLPENVKVPHMGWNQVKIKKATPLFSGIADNSYFYFVHSYYVDPEDEGIIAGTTEYGIEFVSMVAQDRIFGVQFHPEKSSSLGLQILANFGRLVAGC
ncbi:MAG: Imidazole glycerol phosphate synthase subunit HisH [Thermoanaerobacterales bacterium 50_218]|nr:MAG: Imidazole glycerol phosphate synthase subunit HisH [Thermoanaerobacterales bacterium 50_218]HAA90725.1 imidazole glycerol phosphate synthase subunit HisH [Peptococcaceae bacterium]